MYICESITGIVCLLTPGLPGIGSLYDQGTLNDQISIVHASAS